MPLVSRNEAIPVLGNVLVAPVAGTIRIAASLLFGVGSILASPASADVADLVVEPTEIDLGEVEVGESSGPLAVTITNTGTEPFGPIMAFGGGVDSTEFWGTTDCQGEILATGESCEFSYYFEPPNAGLHEAITGSTLSETRDPSDGLIVEITLIGTGVEAPPPTSDPSESTTTTEVEETTTTDDVEETTTTGDVGETSTTTAEETMTSVESDGAAVITTEQPDEPTADAAAALPRTGASTGPAIYAGFGFLTVGLAASAVARRRQARSLS